MKINVRKHSTIDDGLIEMTPETDFESCMLRQCDDVMILKKTNFDTKDGKMTFKLVVPSWVSNERIVKRRKNE